jgi:hypothetical protein
VFSKLVASLPLGNLALYEVTEPKSPIIPNQKIRLMEIKNTAQIFANLSRIDYLCELNGLMYYGFTGARNN